MTRSLLADDLRAHNEGFGQASDRTLRGCQKTQDSLSQKGPQAGQHHTITKTGRKSGKNTCHYRPKNF